VAAVVAVTMGTVAPHQAVRDPALVPVLLMAQATVSVTINMHPIQETHAAGDPVMVSAMAPVIEVSRTVTVIKTTMVSTTMLDRAIAAEDTDLGLAEVVEGVVDLDATVTSTEDMMVSN